MRVLFSVVGMILLMISCSPTDRSANIIERDFTINIATEIGQDFGEGTLRVSKLKNLLTLDSLSYTRAKIVPDAMRVLFVNIAAPYEGKMFQFPLTVGKTWEYSWDGQAQITIVGLTQ